MLSVIGFAACIYFKVNVTLVYDTFLGIITATILWSVSIAVIVYVMAHKQKKGLSPGGNTGLYRQSHRNSGNLEIKLDALSYSFLQYHALVAT